MKQPILTLVFLFCVFLASSQTEKGNFFLSGSTGLGFLSGRNKIMWDGETAYKYNQSTVDLIPSFGYFVYDNLAIGLTSSISFYTAKDEDGDKDKVNTTMLLPSLFYFIPMEGKIRPFVQFGIGYSSEVYKLSPKLGEDQKTSYGGSTFNGGTGFAYFVNNNISINGDLSYTKTNLKNKDDDRSEERSSMFGANIGISIYLN